MDIALELKGDELYSAQVELLIKISAMQKAMASLMCDKFANAEISSDELYQDLITDANLYGKQILQDLYERRGHINPEDIFPRK